MKRTMKNDVIEFIESTVWGYINGIVDDNYDLMTLEGWTDYIMTSLDMDAQGGQRVNGLEFQHLYFYGKDKIKKEAIKYLTTTEDIQEYIVK